ncbi:MAG: DoxX family protein [Cyclobacteriaceae bacterium]
MKKGKARNIFTWVLQVLLGLEFLLAGQAKFTQQDVWAKSFANWGFLDSFYLVIGGLEVLGAILVFIPKFASKAAFGLGIIMVGAAITHAVHGEWSRIIVTLIIAGLCGGVFYLRKNG